MNNPDLTTRPALRWLAILPGFIGFICHSQPPNWDSTPDKGFVFQITNKEAKQLLTHSLDLNKYDQMLHTLVDTFQVDSGWTNRPERGHFILASIAENKVYCQYTSIIPYQVFLLKDYDALSLQVMDASGAVRKDARVKFRWRRIPFDHETNTYRIEHQYFMRESKFVTVELDGFQSVFEINKHNIPYRYNYPDYSSGPDFYSYMITDKNRYRPGDKVRLKSYALTGNRTPIRRPLDLWLIKRKGSKKLTAITPHRPGSFAGEFHLHDSLELTLDQVYSLQLRDKKGRIVASCHFRYEDYELFGNELSVELTDTRQFYPEDNELIIRAVDANGLVLKDAKAHVLITPLNIQKSFQPVTVLPDTLMFRQLDLDPVAPTRLVIPARLFGQSNTSYAVSVTVLNSENERLESRVQSTFFYDEYQLTSQFVHDSIRFELLYNGIAQDSVPVRLRYDDEREDRLVQFPYQEKLNPAIRQYHFTNQHLTESVTLSELAPKLELAGGILEDSFKIVLNNPQQLNVSWYIYRGSTLLEKGFGPEVDFSSFIDDRSYTYYVELLYSFGGKEHMRQAEYKFREQFLNVSLDVPERMYPGQEVQAKVLVKNDQGTPMRGVDLTALAVNHQLGYHLPDLPYYGNTSEPRPRNAWYDKEDLRRHHHGLNLDYDKWAGRAGLDTMIYYQFTYPRAKPFRYSWPVEDSTQFAVYLMKDGRAEQIHVIEVNLQPVYFSWTGRPDRYAFYAPGDSAFQLTLRATDQVLIFDSIRVARGMKTVLSFDLDHLPADVKVHMLPDKFTQVEKNRYLPRVAAFTSLRHRYSYLVSVNEFIPLFGRDNSHRTLLAGPVREEMKTFVTSSVPSITYRHAGGFAYSFEDNIVYRQDHHHLLPPQLTRAPFDPMSNIRHLAWTQKSYLEFQNREKDPPFWNPARIDMVGPEMRLRLDLPNETTPVGVAALLFEDAGSGAIVLPCYTTHSRSQGKIPVPRGKHHVTVLYNDGSYRTLPSLDLVPHTMVVVNFEKVATQQADDRSREWLQQYRGYYSSCFATVEPERAKAYIQYKTSPTGNVTGVIVDESGETLPGATILVKGTTTGTIADMDGKFSIYIDDYIGTLLVTFIGFVPLEVEVMRGTHLIVELEPDVQALEEVVVVGYGSQRKSSLAGAVAGVQISTAEPDEVVPEEEVAPDKGEQQEAEARLYQELMALNSIRSNFSDVAFWEPRLYTDKHGEASFQITFPDNITRWDATVLAMNRRLQTGTERKIIRSYKPLLAELRVPRFLTVGDSALLVGKVSNYTANSTITGTVQWTVDSAGAKQGIRFQHAHTDKTPVITTADKDTITVSYTFTRDDNYFDGEERTIPVVQQGIVRADGFLTVLSNGTRQEVNAAGPDRTKTVEILDSQAEFYAGQIEYLRAYRYECNEQLASKLVGLLNHQLLRAWEGKPEQGVSQIKKIIRRLLKNQNEEFLWSWWDVSSNSSFWVSSHVLRALHLAHQMGYEVPLDLDNIIRKATYKFDFLRYYTLNDVDLVQALATWQAPLDYARYLPRLDSVVLAQERQDQEYQKINRYYQPSSYLPEKLLLLETRQLTGLPCSTDTLLQYRKETIRGELRFTDEKRHRHWYRDELAANTIAYRIIKNDSLLHELAEPLQLYFLASNKGYGWNTYQSANAVMTILPDLLTAGFSSDQSAKVIVSGKVDTTVTSFPFKLQLGASDTLDLYKESGQPLYYQEYTHERVTSAKTGVPGFRIHTYFDQEGPAELKAGQPTDLVARVVVEKDASFEYAMIEIPIPGACSYTDKRQPYYRGVETHREYFRDRTVIFCERLTEGTHYFKVQLLPRFTGRYHINPAQVSLMYVPVINANTDMKQVVVSGQ